MKNKKQIREITSLTRAIRDRFRTGRTPTAPTAPTAPAVPVKEEQYLGDFFRKLFPGSYSDVLPEIDNIVDIIEGFSRSSKINIDLKKIRSDIRDAYEGFISDASPEHEEAPEATTTTTHTTSPITAPSPLTAPIHEYTKKLKCVIYR